MFSTKNHRVPVLINLLLIKKTNNDDITVCINDKNYLITIDGGVGDKSL